MKAPKRKASNEPDELAFNLRLERSIADELDAIAKGGPVALSRNQLIQRVLGHFVLNFRWEQDRLNEFGEKDAVPAKFFRMHSAAGYLIADRVGLKGDE